MPRRAVQKCSRRHAGETIDTTDELCLVWGHCFGIGDWERPLQSRAEFSRLWNRWGDELTRRWIAAYPGSRPAGLYVLGLIQPPDWKHEWPACRHPISLKGEVVVEDRGWHGRDPEIDHLVALGLVDDGEYEAAVKRLDGPEPTSGQRYEKLARE